MVEDIKLELDEKNHGYFYYLDENKRLGEMEIGLSGNKLTVYHTEVSAEAEGKGLAKKLLDAMIGYARKNNLKVITLCPFVHAQFKRHSKEYADVLDTSRVN